MNNTNANKAYDAVKNNDDTICTSYHQCDQHNKINTRKFEARTQSNTHQNVNSNKTAI